MIDLFWLDPIRKAALDASTAVNAFFPSKHIWMKRNVNFAPLVSSDPRENSNICNGQVITTDISLSLQLRVQHPE